jgi:hypothetical protein
MTVEGLLFNRKLGMESMETIFTDRPFSLPDFILEKKNQIIKARIEDAVRTGRIFHDGSLVRLESWHESAGHLILRLGKTSWFDYISSNRIIDEKIFNGRSLRSMIEEKSGVPEYECLANPVTVTTSIITSDSKILVSRRSMKLSQYPGMFTASSSGFMDIKDVIKGSPHPFESARRETKEELNLSVPVGKFKLNGIMRSSEYMHFQVLLEARVDFASDEMLKNMKTSDEVDEVVIIERDVKAFRTFLKKHPTEEWVPAGLNAVRLSLKG